MAVPIRILLVEDYAPDASFIETRLLQTALLRVSVEKVTWLKSAVTLLANKTFDVVLLDLGLPDSQGIDTLVEVLKIAPNVPVIVLSGREDLETSVLAVRAGAQSYIVKKPGLTPEQLEREIFYAWERKTNDITAKKLSRASMTSLTVSEDGHGRSSVPPPVDTGMLSRHIATIEEAVASARVYLMKNAPTQADAVQDILQHGGFYVAIREIRSFLKLDEEGGPRTRKISDVAISAVSDMSLPSASSPKNLAEAREALLDVIGDEEDGRG